MIAQGSAADPRKRASIHTGGPLFRHYAKVRSGQGEWEAVKWHSHCLRWNAGCGGRSASITGQYGFGGRAGPRGGLETAPPLCAPTVTVVPVGSDTMTEGQSDVSILTCSISGLRR